MFNKTSTVTIIIMILSYFTFYSISFSKNIKLNGLVISNYWIKEPIGKQSIASGYLTIKNTNTFDEYLINITSKISKKIEIHEMIIKDDIMRMKLLVDGLKIRAGSVVHLKPGGYHIMFKKLKINIKAMDNHKINLNFKKSGILSINTTVYKKITSKVSNKHNH